MTCTGDHERRLGRTIGMSDGLSLTNVTVQLRIADKISGSLSDERVKERLFVELGDMAYWFVLSMASIFWSKAAPSFPS